MYVKKWSNGPISNHFWFPLMPKVIRPIKAACIPILMARLERLDLAAKIRELSLIFGFIMGGSKFFSNFLSGLSHHGLPWGRVWVCMLSRGNFGHIWAEKIRELFSLSNYGGYYGRGQNFSLIFCWVYHTRGFLGDVYECACQLEAISSTFEIVFFGKN